MSDDLSAEQRSILDTLQRNGPMTRQQLAAATNQPTGPTGTRVAQLAARGLVKAGAELVALPRQQAEPWRPDVEAEHERRRELWQRRGLLTLTLDEVPDGYLAQQLRVLAVQLYGQRRRHAAPPR